MNCVSCKFWKKSEYNCDLGECRRFPPKIFTEFFDYEEDLSLDSVLMGTRFPVTSYDDFCGEFQSLKCIDDLREDSDRDYE